MLQQTLYNKVLLAGNIVKERRRKKREREREREEERECV